jgi:hypothetical protein
MLHSLSIGNDADTKLCYYVRMRKGELASWLEKKFLDWQMINGRASIVEFAKYLGVSNEYAYQLINGHRAGVSREVALRFAQLLQDFEIFDILGYARPEPQDLLRDFPPDLRDPILAALSEAKSELVSKGITTDGPAAQEILSIAFKRHGVNFTFTK